jgi:hypothetical protein
VHPQIVHLQWGSICEGPWRRFLAADARGDFVARGEALFEFYSLPSKFLLRGRGGNQRNRKALIKRLEGRGDPQGSPVQSDSSSSQPPQPDPDAEFTPAQDKAARRAQFFADAGEYGKAARALTQQPIADATRPAIQAQLSSTHRSRASPLRRLNRELPSIAITDPVEFKENHLMKLCRRSGADAFGWTGELTKAFFANATCSKGFCRLLDLISNNQLTTVERACTIVSTIIPICKATPSKVPFSQQCSIRKQDRVSPPPRQRIPRSDQSRRML